MGDEDRKRKIITSMVLASLGVGSYYLLKDDFKEFIEIKEVIKKESENDSIVIKKKEDKNEDIWSGMTWEKLKTILGSRLQDENLLEAYYRLSREEKMSWRRAVCNSVKTPLDKSFVYLDSRIISQVYGSLSSLREMAIKYSKDQVSFEELYAVYRETLRKLGFERGK